MSSTVLTHPAFTFVGGIVVTLAAVFVFLKSNTAPNDSAAAVAGYNAQLEKVVASGLESGSPGEKAALDRFTGFLQGIGDVKFVRANASKVYASTAYLDDTLAIHRGEAEIEAYFTKTSETMKSYEVTINDIAKSGDDYYVRWTMVFAAPALSGGEPVHSIGVSQVRFNREGKVEFHQDFWDSGKNFHGHLPGVGGAVGFVRKRLQSN